MIFYFIYSQSQLFWFCFLGGIVIHCISIFPRICYSNLLLRFHMRPFQNGFRLLLSDNLIFESYAFQKSIEILKCPSYQNFFTITFFFPSFLFILCCSSRRSSSSRRGNSRTQRRNWCWQGKYGNKWGKEWNHSICFTASLIFAKTQSVY